MNLIVTTSKRFTIDQVEEAKAISRHLGIAYVERKLLSHYLEKNEQTSIIRVERNQLVLSGGGEDFFWHPSAAKLTLGELDRFRISSMPSALKLESGDHIVDATLGLASDALRMALLLGDEGKITGVEANAVMALLTQKGLERVHEDYTALGEAAGKIEVHHQHHLDYLERLPSKSVDTVYFDPMFKMPKGTSAAINAFRQLACHEPLSEVAIREAIRVAKKAVVVKERYGMGEFERLGLPLYFGRESYGEIGYGAVHL